jgi:hypothetical protein
MPAARMGAIHIPPHQLDLGAFLAFLDLEELSPDRFVHGHGTDRTGSELLRDKTALTPMGGLRQRMA